MFKHKAHLNVRGRKQEYALNVLNKLLPVVTWFINRMVLVIPIINELSRHQVDFFLAFPQDNIEFDMYMDIKTKVRSRMTHILKILNNLYGKSQGSRVFNKHIIKGLEEIDFQQSRVDNCMLYQCEVIFFIYVNDGIFTSPIDSAIDQAIKDIGTKVEI